MTVLAPRVPIALLLEPDHRYLARAATTMGAVAIHVAKQLVDASFVRWCQQRCLCVVPWTVNDVEQARRLLTLGVDGVITDDPMRLRALFE